MASRTRIICLHEGVKGRSIDPLFINVLIKRLNPAWLRPWPGSNAVHTVDCGGRPTLMARLPDEIRAAERAGGDTTVMVWADVDDDMDGPEALKDAFWKASEAAGIARNQFDRVVFAFAKDRLENWIQFLNEGATDETLEGPRVRDCDAVRAARALADRCLRGETGGDFPPSLGWSCHNWRALRRRMP